MKIFPTYKQAKTLLLSVVMLMAISEANAQQSASYTQYMDNLTPLNPAYSLIDKAGSINTLVREQYVGIKGAPNTFILNANVPIESIDGAAGIVINNDNFAVEHQFLVNGYFAKAVQVTEGNYLGVALNFGVRNYNADYSGLAPGDPVFFNDIRETKANIGFGVMYFSEDYYFGVSVPQLTFRNLGNGSLLDNNYFRNNYYFSAGYLGEIDEQTKFKPAVLVSYVRGVPVTADISTTLYFLNEFGVGLNYRTNNEVALIMSFSVNSFHLGYSYQFGTSYSNIPDVSSGTHEVTLSYRFGRNAVKPKLL
jgi:type IX secretion system PorP/SprF family membrane protein